MEAVVRFEQRLREEARKALEAESPQYVSTFLTRLEETGDPQQAAQAAEPLLGGGLPQKWQNLLTTFLDLQLMIDKLDQSLILFKERPLDADNSYLKGTWTISHLDLWIFYVNALAERLEKVIKQFCRELLRSKDRVGSQNVQKELMSNVEGIKREMSKARHPLAHGGFAVDSIQKDQLWWPIVILGRVPSKSLNRSYYETVSNSYDDLVRIVESSSNIILDKTNETITELHDQVFE